MNIRKQVELTCSNYSNPTVIRMDRSSIDVIGLFLNAFVLIAAWIGYTFPVVILTDLDVDPLKQLFGLSFLPANIFRNELFAPLTLLFRLIFHSGTALACARTCAFLCPGVIVGAKYLSEFIDGIVTRTRLITYASPKKFMDMYLMYCRLILIVKKVDSTLAPLALAAMSFVVLGFVGSSFVTVRYYFVLPFIMYCMFPFGSIFALVIPRIVFPEAIRIFEDGTEIIRSWNLKLAIPAGRYRKFRQMKLKALRPCRIHVGLGEIRFFWVKRSTMTTFYSLCIYYSVNLLISVP
jgi:hypothetical protein